MAHINEWIDRLAEVPEIRPVSTGIERLDRMGVRFVPGKLYVIGGRPGMGKTSLMLDLALHAALGELIPVHIISLSESAEELAWRLISREETIPLYRIEQDASVRKKAAEISRAMFKRLPLFIYDRIRTAPEIIDTILHEKMSGLVFIDDLQLVAAATGQNIDGRPVCTDHPELREQNALCDLFQVTARDTNTAIVVFSQLSRKLERRRDKRPKLGDIEYSPCLEAAASAVLFLYRDAYYHPETPTENPEPAEIIVAKNTDGSTGTVSAYFENEYFSFG